jgi:hypothetical protein
MSDQLSSAAIQRTRWMNQPFFHENLHQRKDIFTSIDVHLMETTQSLGTPRKGEAFFLLLNQKRRYTSKLLNFLKIVQQARVQWPSGCDTGLETCSNPSSDTFFSFSDSTEKNAL